MAKIKSAWEIALEKIGGIDKDKLTQEQKKKIQEIRKIYKAKRAELEIMMKNEISKLLDKVQPHLFYVEKQKIEEKYRKKIQELKEEEEREVEKIKRQT